MNKLDLLDEDLSASDQDLSLIADTVKPSDIDAVIVSDIPWESKKSQLSGLVALLKETGRDDVLSHAKAALSKTKAQISDPIIPQITS